MAVFATQILVRNSSYLFYPPGFFAIPVTHAPGCIMKTRLEKAVIRFISPRCNTPYEQKGNENYKDYCRENRFLEHIQTFQKKFILLILQIIFSVKKITTGDFKNKRFEIGKKF